MPRTVKPVVKPINVDLHAFAFSPIGFNMCS